MMILTMTILPTIIIILVIILLMMLVILPAIVGTQEEQDVFPYDTTMNTVRLTTVWMSITSSASPSSTSPYKKSRKWKELQLQWQRFGAFIQKLHYPHIGSSCSGFKWITAILYKLWMTIWTLWQFHNNGKCLSTSAWQLLLDILQ